MNINYKESQYDFLASSQDAYRDPRSPRVLSAQLMLSVENLVIFAIASIMVLLFCFSLGVERGKLLVLSESSSTPVATTATRATAAPVKNEIQEDADAAAQPAETRQNVFSALLAALGRSKDVAADQDATPEVESASVSKAEKVVTADAPRSVASAKQTAPAIATPGGYTVQVATYKSEKFARKEATSLKQKGYQNVQVISKGAFVIVCVGNFSSKADAGAFTRQLKNRYQDTVVRRL